MNATLGDSTTGVRLIGEGQIICTQVIKLAYSPKKGNLSNKISWVMISKTFLMLLKEWGGGGGGWSFSWYLILLNEELS